MIPWRLIISPPLDGATNMAIDEALFRYSSQPTLRFYSWSSPTLTLGYFQKAGKSLIVKCKENGIDVVRRPTGGRAILHDNEITYSVVSSYKSFPKPSTLQGIYKALALWQIASFEAIGMNATLPDGGSTIKQNYVTNDACFLTSIQSEVMVEGKKICGSAQKRGNDSFLQHGSIPVEMDLELLSKALKIDSNDSSAGLLNSVGWLNQWSDKPIAIPDVEKLLAEVFAKHLQIDWIHSEPSHTEMQEARRMSDEKFNHPEWNMKR